MTTTKMMTMVIYHDSDVGDDEDDALLMAMRLPLAISDQGPQTAVTVVESPAQEADGTTLGLETFLRNMAAERIQYHLYEVTFQRDVETCAREHVKAYKIKYADNTELISAVFGVRWCARLCFNSLPRSFHEFVVDI